MLDNQLIRIFLPIINQGLLAAGYSVEVVQSDQPVQAGVNTRPTVFFQKIYDNRYGFRDAKDTFDNLTGDMVHTETQQYETTFQFQALVIANPEITDTFTASDLLNEVAAILQSEATIKTLLQQEVAVLRIINVRAPNFQDDRDRSESVPSFDCVFLHKQVTTSTVPTVTSAQSGLYGI